MKRVYRAGLRGRVIALADRGFDVAVIARVVVADPTYVRATLRRAGFHRIVRWIRAAPPPLPLVKEHAA
jgi:hypothetical protein